MIRLLTVTLLTLAGFDLASASTMEMEGRGVVTVAPDQFRIYLEVEHSSASSREAWILLRKSLEDLHFVSRQEKVQRDQFSVLGLQVDKRGSAFEARAYVSIVVPIGPGNELLLDAIQRGTKVRVTEFGYSHSDARALSDKARAFAVQDAMAQMKQLAESSGGYIGRILSIGKQGQRVGNSAVRMDDADDIERLAVPLSPGLVRFAGRIRVEAEFIKTE